MQNTGALKNLTVPSIPPGLRLVETRIVPATPESLAGYGQLVFDSDNHPVEIVRWPAKG